tara:strand:- start:2272 stop:2451 length:180 start_codon:yes stop_codon:yes gene_type:complete
VIEFVLYIYLGEALYNKTQVFDDINRCRYFAERLNDQRSIPQPNGTQKKLTAVCFPKDK